MKSLRRRLALLTACGTLFQFTTCTEIATRSLITGFLNASTNVLRGPVQDVARDTADDFNDNRP